MLTIRAITSLFSMVQGKKGIGERGLPSGSDGGSHLHPDRLERQNSTTKATAYTRAEEKKVRQKIEDTISKHLISDREVGLFLSGGTDSASIAQIMSNKQKTKLKTFTYDFRVR